MTGERALRLAVMVPKTGVVSESFISAHIEGLFDDTVVVSGSPRPLMASGGERVLSSVPGAFARALRFAWRMTDERAQGAVGRRLSESTYVAQMARFLRRAQVDVVLAEYGTTAVEVMRACSAAAKPLVVHFHGFDAYQESILDQLRELYGELFRRATRVVVVSEHMRRHLVSLGSPPQRTVCIPCGVDVDRFLGADPAVALPLVVALGRFVAKKGPHLTLEAFARAHAEEKSSRLVMLGDGPLRDECKARAVRLGIADSVEFPGPVEHEAVVDWMRKARCFVQHSIRAADGDSEGTPVAVLEAAACGLPVVSTRHGGIFDAVIHGVSGLLVDEGDVEAMARALLRLLRDPSLAATMGARGRAHMEDRYSSKASLGRLRLVLREAAADAIPGRAGR